MTFVLCNNTFIHYKIGIYDGHDAMENGGKSYVDRRTVRECTVRLHLFTFSVCRRMLVYRRFDM